MPSGRRDLLVAAGAGALFFLYRYGPGVLDPTRLDWLLGRGDPAFHQLAFDFFRREPWSWPPGRVVSWYWPVGSSVLLTDSLPLLALPLKLAGGLLPRHFQFWGIWLLLCHVLQAVFGLLLARTLTDDRRAQFGAMLLALAMPAWLHRIGHLALSSQWILLAAWWLYRREEDGASTARRGARWLLLLGTAAWVHPYLWLPAFGVATAAWLRGWRRGRWGLRGALLPAGAVLALSLGLWYLAGAFLPGATYRAEGLGAYAMNLNAWANSLDTSRWMPGLPLRTWGQTEGFNYLGLPLLVLGPLAVLAALSRRRGRARLRSHAEALVLCLLLTLYALGPQWNLGDAVVARPPWPAFLLPAAEVFRATGRFFWTVSYALLALVVVESVDVLGARRAGFLLGLGALVLVVEMQPMERVDRFLAPRLYQARPWEKALAAHLPRGGRLIPVPPLVSSARADGREDWVPLARVALSRDAAFSGGRVARTDEAACRAWREEVAAALREGRTDPRALYLLREAGDLSPAAGDTLRVGGYLLLRRSGP